MNRAIRRFVGSLNGPKKVITSIGRVEQDADTAIYTDAQGDFKLSFMQVSVESITANTLENNVYNPSVSFVKIAEDWSYGTAKVDGFEINAFVCKHNAALSSVLSKGDILLSPDDTNLTQVGENMQGDADEFCDNTIVQGSGIDDNGLYYVAKGKIKLSKENYEQTIFIINEVSPARIVPISTHPFRHQCISTRIFMSLPAWAKTALLAVWPKSTARPT